MMAVKNKSFVIVLILALSLLSFIVLRWVLPRDKEKAAEIAASAQIAIVIDDWGYSLKNLPLLFEIKSPLTVSILPDVVYSTQIATAMNKRKNFEIIIHLPLEPEDIPEKNLESGTLYTSMSKEEIIASLDKALKSIPYAVGVSNHMGSKATRDEDFMRVLFSGIRTQKLFFLDSLVTPGSICEELSRQMNVRFARRSVFLDNDTRPEYIKSQLAQLVSKSKSEGSAIGIGHGNKATLKVLKEMIPRLEEQGIQFVHLSQLAK